VRPAIARYGERFRIHPILALVKHALEAAEKVRKNIFGPRMNTDKPILFNLCSSVFIRGPDAFGVFQQAL
jgi:hypothetical protein